jgi:hypothetical protein
MCNYEMHCNRLNGLIIILIYVYFFVFNVVRIYQLSDKYCISKENILEEAHTSFAVVPSPSGDKGEVR